MVSGLRGVVLSVVLLGQWPGKTDVGGKTVLSLGRRQQGCRNRTRRIHTPLRSEDRVVVQIAAGQSALLDTGEKTVPKGCDSGGRSQQEYAVCDDKDFSNG